LALIYVDELNRDEPARSRYLEPREPLGAFSKSFLANVASEASPTDGRHQSREASLASLAPAARANRRKG
jgi:hypothetical protein